MLFCPSAGKELGYKAWYGATVSPTVDTWFTSWFNSLYLRLYQHRDEQEARQQICALLSLIPPPDLALDIACGSGRHVAAFYQEGINCIGLDRSATLLKHRTQSLPLLQADMRELPFGDQQFTLLTNFFTSFGYFDDDDQHLRLLREWVRVLKIQGYLFIDYLNAPHVVQSLQPETTRDVDGMQVRETRSISSDGTRVLKKIEVTNPLTGNSQTYRESVRMYSREELTQLLISAQCEVISVFGGFSPSPDRSMLHYTEQSPRLLVLAQRRGHIS